MIEAIAVSGTPDAEKRRCFDCYHCKAAVSWWCTNDEAAKERRTHIPGTDGRKHWKAIRRIDELSWWQRKTLDYISVHCS